MIESPELKCMYRVPILDIKTARFLFELFWEKTISIEIEAMYN